MTDKEFKKISNLQKMQGTRKHVYTSELREKK